MQSSTPAAPALATKRQVWTLVKLATGKKDGEGFRAVADQPAYEAMTNGGEDGAGKWIERLNSRLPLPEGHRHEPADRGEQFEKCMCGVVRTSGGDWTLLPDGMLPTTWVPIQVEADSAKTGGRVLPSPRPGSVEERHIREARKHDNRPARCPDCRRVCCACPTIENIRAAFFGDADVLEAMAPIYEIAGHDDDADDCKCGVCSWYAAMCDTCEDNPCVCEATT